MTKTQHKKALLFVLSFLPITSMAGPYLTDDATPLDFKRYGLELNGTFAHAKDSPNEFGAGVEVKFGLLPNTELFLAMGYEHISQHGEEPALHGLGDSEVGIKYRFAREGTFTPAIAIVPTVGMPTGRVSNDRAWAELPLWLEMNWGDFSTSAGVGVVYNPAHEAKNFFFAGGKMQYGFTEALNGGAEILYQGPDSEDNRDLTLVNVGSEVKLTDVFSVNVSVGHTIAGQPQTIAYLGLSLS